MVSGGFVELLLPMGHSLHSSQAEMAEIVRVTSLVGLNPAVFVEAPLVLGRPVH